MPNSTGGFVWKLLALRLALCGAVHSLSIDNMVLGVPPERGTVQYSRFVSKHISFPMILSSPAVFIAGVSDEFVENVSRYSFNT